MSQLGARVKSLVVGESHVEASIAIDASHPAFAGHFPGNPIFPAVAQLELVEQILGLVSKEPVRIQSISQAKFLVPIRPYTTAQLTIDWDQSMVSWTLTDGQRILSKGKLGLGAPYIAMPQRMSAAIPQGASSRF